MGVKLAGDCSMKVDGVLYEVADLSVNVGTEEKAAVVSSTGVPGYKVTKRAAYATGTLIITPDTDVAAFNAIDGSEIAFQYADGRGYALHDAWIAEPLDHDGMEGTASFRLEASSADTFPAA